MIYQELQDEIIDAIYYLLLIDNKDAVIYIKFDVSNYLNKFAMEISDELPTSSFLYSKDNIFKIILNDIIIVGNLIFNKNLFNSNILIFFINEFGHYTSYLCLFKSLI